MDQPSSRGLHQFKTAVGTKFQLYNSLFTSLPFHRIEKTGILLALFLNHCEESYKNRLSPLAIVESFFDKYTFFREHPEQMDLLFRFVQYAERQVVLFDAVEDAAFEEVNDLGGAGTLKQLQARVVSENRQEELQRKLEHFTVTLVLTAHPTQFYPGSVLGIINDLSQALKENNTVLINNYLQQLGKTPLFKQQKPTPYDEAVSLIWYLEHVFYYAAGRVLLELKHISPAIDLSRNPVIRMGFWPGGDRDGNPNVTADITLKVAQALHTSIIKCYYREVRHLKRRLTFKKVDGILADLESLLYEHIFLTGRKGMLQVNDLLQPLLDVRELLVYEHNSLFLSRLDVLIGKVHAFGLHFASLDVRQESSVHAEVMESVSVRVPQLKDYGEKPEPEKLEVLFNLATTADPNEFEGIVRETLLSVDVIREIQARNGEHGCHRYIISQCQSAANVLEVYALFLLRGWKKEEISIDIVPLFETVEDLKHAAGVMRTLYAHPGYADHLKRRSNKQVVMVGFSDGTKDGGYLMANWSIYRAKEELTSISREHGVNIVFFDGRGGPPARGGGKTHKFYASMGKGISTEEIQLTVQGQTVSSNFGAVASAQYNLEQLLHAGISNTLFAEGDKPLQPQQAAVLQQLAEASFSAYKQLKDHPDFLNYLAEVSPLRYYSDTNISSRPSKRGAGQGLSLKDLRAIPFVGAWSQLKQNVPGYFGFGTALESIDREGRFAEIQHIYDRSGYFRTLVDNCEMAMKKTYFPLTAYLADDPRYSELWTIIREEYERTARYLSRLSGQNELMHNYPVEQLSIQMRERIVLPLTTIQQYALHRLRMPKPLGKKEKEVLEKLVIRTSFGIINAGRNAV